MHTGPAQNGEMGDTSLGELIDEDRECVPSQRYSPLWRICRVTSFGTALNCFVSQKRMSFKLLQPSQS